MRQCFYVFGKTTTPVSQASVKHLIADALIVAHAGGDFLDIGAQQVADTRNLIDERNLGGKECVGGVFNHLRLVEVSDDDGARRGRYNSATRCAAARST